MANTEWKLQIAKERKKKGQNINCMTKERIFVSKGTIQDKINELVTSISRKCYNRRWKITQNFKDALECLRLHSKRLIKVLRDWKSSLEN